MAQTSATAVFPKVEFANVQAVPPPATAPLRLAAIARPRERRRRPA